VVYLTDLLVKSALLAGIPVATSEIHGLSQRAGSVVAGLTFGQGGFGFVEKGGAHFLLGLEALEGLRCANYLNRESRAVIDSHRILPYAVNAGVSRYPDVELFRKKLAAQIRELVWIDEKEVDTTHRNMYIVGKACQLEGFPVPAEYIRMAIENKGDRHVKSNLEVFNKAIGNNPKKSRVYGETAR